MVQLTQHGTPYLTASQVVTLASTSLDYTPHLEDFLTDYDPSFSDYYEEDIILSNVESADLLSKIAGQLCYLSFGPQRTKSTNTLSYLTRIKSEQHGSVLEHASATFLLYGISRSLTHELVRHRAGFSYSQVSQRYVSRPRFVERIEYQTDPHLHANFLTDIDTALAQYNDQIAYLEGHYLYSTIQPRTERLKAIRQAARSVLPNCTEAPIIVTANHRAWRHFLEQRGSPHSETEIRSLAFKVLNELSKIAPLIYEDYQELVTSNGTHYIETQYRKV